jgi:hypothetical protein
MTVLDASGNPGSADTVRDDLPLVIAGLVRVIPSGEARRLRGSGGQAQGRP